MTDETTAREIARRFAELSSMPDEGAIREGAAMIAAALSAARREGIEAAARVAETGKGHWRDIYIAAAILALLDTPKGEPT